MAEVDVVAMVLEALSAAGAVGMPAAALKASAPMLDPEVLDAALHDLKAAGYLVKTTAGVYALSPEHLRAACTRCGRPDGKRCLECVNERMSTGTYPEFLPAATYDPFASARAWRTCTTCGQPWEAWRVDTSDRCQKCRAATADRPRSTESA